MPKQNMSDNDDLSNIKGNIKGMSWFQLSVSIIKQSNTCQQV